MSKNEDETGEDETGEGKMGEEIERVISRDLVALLATRARRFGRWPALRYQPAQGPLQELSWADWLDQARALASVLRATGFQPGDTAAIYARGCPEWLVVDLGIMMAGGVSVPLARSAPSAARARMLIETRPRAVFAGTAGDLERLRRNRARLGETTQLILLHGDDTVGIGGGTQLLRDLLIRGRAIAERGDGVLPDHSGRDPDAPATVIYSAGRTGPARGTVHTHRAVVSKLYALRDVVVLPRSATQLLILPLDSMFGRLMAWAAIDQGATTWIANHRTPLSEALFEVRPHFIAGVPAFYERLRDRVLTKREGAMGIPGRVTLSLSTPFLDPERPAKGRRLIGRLDKRAARRFFRTRVKHLLGGRIRHLVCGGGLLDPSAARLFAFAGVPILEGYGSNESLGAAVANRPDEERPGSVGMPLSDVELKLSPEGEVLLRGTGMFAGYLRPNPGAREPAWDIEPATDEQGWFLTRDLGMIEDDFLFLTGRKEDIIHLSTGRSVAPGPIERALQVSPRVQHAVVCGDGRAHVAALLWPAATTGPGERDVASPPDPEADPAAWKRLVDAVNLGLERHEQIKAYRLMRRRLSLEDGEISTNGEVARSVVIQRFAADIDSLYSES